VVVEEKSVAANNATKQFSEAPVVTTICVLICGDQSQKLFFFTHQQQLPHDTDSILETLTVFFPRAFHRCSTERPRPVLESQRWRLQASAPKILPGAQFVIPLFSSR
jgi:hypothetical protein